MIIVFILFSYPLAFIILLNAFVVYNEGLIHKEEKMASKIRVLSDHTINKIAAGEVIENPASVVKELVENSLDAGSTDIAIEIQGGGRQMIRISDNGCGMGPDDALLCLERHATSKLREVEDIHTLSTMGFRGEAIPSIASISKFNLLTCSAQESTGTMVIVDGGKIVSCHPAARSQGTTIEVKSLFFNVPVRKKFLKSPTIDANEILKTISLIALGHPSIKFQLISDGKHLLTAPASKDYAFDKQLTVRIEDVLGRDFNENITYIEKQSEGVSLRGMIGRPGYTRHNRSAQYLFINKRAIVSPFIAYAVKEGFGTSIPAGRFPVYLLHLEMAGELVDVNVHPQKREVRLRQEQLIKELVVTAVRSGISYVSDPFLSDLPNNYVSPIFSKILQEPESVDFKDIPETWVFKAKPEAPYSLPKPEISHFDEPATHREPPKRILPPQALQLSLSKEQPLKVLATIPGYIILDGLTTHSFIEKGCKHNGGFVLIDQKSAHARILFEKLLQGQSTGPIPQQTLLIPYTLELASHETEKLQRVIPALNKMGIQIREFGVNTYLIDAIPQMFGENQVDLFVKDLVHNLCTMSSEQTDEEAVSHNQAKHIAQAATRTSISLQTHLSLIEAQSLIDRLLSCQQPYQCPSGRPTLVQISSDDLAKLFHR